MRLKAVLALKSLYEVEEFLPNLESLTERCKVHSLILPTVSLLIPFVVSYVNFLPS